MIPPRPAFPGMRRLARRPRARHTLVIEEFEGRLLPSVVTVDAGSVIRPVNRQVLGANLAWWDSALNTTQTRQMVQAAGLNFFRIPGGWFADVWHFNDPQVFAGGNTSGNMAQFIASMGAAGMVTVNYGTGSPQEAAAYLAYLNARVGDTTAIGLGPQWNVATTSWVNRDWKTAGYWASLRAATPLPLDDGLNFLRLGRAQPFGIKYWEVGNEIYGIWAADLHTAPHDPYTYVAFTSQFADYAAQIDPAVSIGVDGSGPGSDAYPNSADWTKQVLQQCAARAFTPDFLSDHSYVVEPGFENDANLLLHAASDPTAVSVSGPINWSVRAKAYRVLIGQYLGAAGANVRLMATEVNSVSIAPSSQTSSLVNGLWLADSLGGILQTEYESAVVYALRSNFDTHRYLPSLYGWRKGGDYGMIGSSGPSPATGTYVPYPNYFAEQLLSKMVHDGDTVVRAGTDDPTVSAYAVKQANGHLGLLVINKNPNTDLTPQFQIAGFVPSGAATVWRYGKAQDDAQSRTIDGQSSLASSTTTLSVNGSTFSYSLPQYSMTVLDLAPLSGLPSGWTDADVGGPGRAGGASFDGTTWTVIGGGADIGGTSDQFHFTSRALTGNGSVIARVAGLTAASPLAEAGVMLRNGTDPNASFAGVVLTPGNGVAFQWRTNAGGSSGAAQVAGVGGPLWVKLTRAGNLFAGYYSTDGVRWTQVGGIQAIAMGATVRAGLAVSAHNDASLATSRFTGVAVQSGFTTALSRAVWVASASSTEAGGSAARAIDGSTGTRWSSGTRQTAGQWFQLDLGSSQTFQGLVMDSTGTPLDVPRGYAVYVSDNGTDWSSQTAVATGTGSSVTSITLAAAVTKRYVRIVLTRSDPFWWWSIHDLGLFV